MLHPKQFWQKPAACEEGIHKTKPCSVRAYLGACCHPAPEPRAPPSTQSPEESRLRCRAIVYTAAVLFSHSNGGRHETGRNRRETPAKKEAYDQWLIVMSDRLARYSSSRCSRCSSQSRRQSGSKHQGLSTEARTRNAWGYLSVDLPWCRWRWNANVGRFLSGCRVVQYDLSGHLVTHVVTEGLRRFSRVR